MEPLVKHTLPAPLPYVGSLEDLVNEMNALVARGWVAQIPLSEVPQCLHGNLRKFLGLPAVSYSMMTANPVVTGRALGLFWDECYYSGKSLPVIQFSQPERPAYGPSSLPYLAKLLLIYQRVLARVRFT